MSFTPLFAGNKPAENALTIHKNIQQCVSSLWGSEESDAVERISSLEFAVKIEDTTARAEFVSLIHTVAHLRKTKREAHEFLKGVNSQVGTLITQLEKKETQ